MTQEKLDKANELVKAIENLENTINYIEQQDKIYIDSERKTTDGGYTSYRDYKFKIDGRARICFVDALKKELETLRKELEEL